MSEGQLGPSQLGSVIYLTPYGQSKSSINNAQDPYCYLLEIDQAKILLDCGATWTPDAMKVSHLDALAPIVKDLDAIVCCHATLANIGGLPYLYGTLGATCPIYMTVAAFLMAQILFSDTYQLIQERENHAKFLASFPLNGINTVLSQVVGIRYSQPIHLTGKAEGIKLIAQLAGHTLGGAYWKIRKSSEDILYCAQFNHKKERHLDGSALLSVVKPSVLIADASQTLSVEGSKRDRDEDFMNLILSQLRTPKGDVLIPVEPTGRVLELLLLFESRWAKHRYPYPIYFIGNKGELLIDYVKSMLEWMSDGISKSFTANRENPFDFKHIKILPDFDSLQRLEANGSSEPMRSRVVLATSGTLDDGPSRSIFGAWASNPAALVLLTQDNYRADSLAGSLLTKMDAAKTTDAKGRSITQPFSLHFSIARSRILEGEALAQWQASQEVLQQSTPDLLAQVDYEGGGGSEEEEETDEVPSVLLEPVKKGVREGPLSQWYQQKLYDWLVPDSDRTWITFPFIEKKRTYTEYGEVLDPQVYMFCQVTPSHPEANQTEEDGQDVVRALLGAPASNSQIRVFVQPAPPRAFLTPQVFDGRVALSIRHYIFTSLVDGKRLKSILEQIHPKKLVLVHADLPARRYLTQTLRLGGAVEDTNVLLLDNLQRENISSLSGLLQLSIDPTLFSCLPWTTKDTYQVAPCMASLNKDQTTLLLPPKTHTNSLRLLFQAMQRRKKQSAPARTSQSSSTLVSPMQQSSSALSYQSAAVSMNQPVATPTIQYNPTLYIGDARLASLRTFLSKLLIGCHFQGTGRLYIPFANITIYKGETSRHGAAEQLIIDGANASDAFFSIQRLIQSHLLPIHA